MVAEQIGVLLVMQDMVAPVEVAEVVKDLTHQILKVVLHLITSQVMLVMDLQAVVVVLSTKMEQMVMQLLVVTELA